MTTYFTAGDKARYDGDALQAGQFAIVSGDVVSVVTGNIDEDDDVIVNLTHPDFSATLAVSPQDLIWLSAAW